MGNTTRNFTGRVHSLRNRTIILTSSSTTGNYNGIGCTYYTELILKESL